MRFRRVIKWAHCIVTLSLLAFIAAFLWANHQLDRKSQDALQHAYKLSENVWLYVTLNDSGGATVPTIYRYYLSKPLSGNSTEITAQLHSITPFLEGKGSITHAEVDKNGAVSLSYSGNIFSLNGEFSDIHLTLKP